MYVRNSKQGDLYNSTEEGLLNSLLLFRMKKNRYRFSYQTTTPYQPGIAEEDQMLATYFGSLSLSVFGEPKWN